MPDFALYAVIGLLLLLPLELLLIIILAAVKKRRSAAPRIVLPQSKTPARYGWEDYLKLPRESAFDHRRALRIIGVIAAIIAIASVPAYLFIAQPQLFSGANASNESVTESVNGSFYPSFLNQSLIPSFNATLPSFNATLPGFDFPSAASLVGAYRFYIGAAAVAVVAIAAVLAFFLLFASRRKRAVIAKARKASEKLIDKSSPQSMKRGIPALGAYLFPAAILALLAVLALAVYLLRDSIRGDFSQLLLGFLASLRGYAETYRLYVAAGIVLLILLILAFNRLKPDSKPL